MVLIVLAAWQLVPFLVTVVKRMVRGQVVRGERVVRERVVQELVWERVVWKLVRECTFEADTRVTLAENSCG